MDFLPPNSNLLRVEPGAFIPIAVVCGIGVVMASIFIAVNIKYRGYKLLKMTSPNLNLVMLSGSILLFLSVLLFGSTSWLPEDPNQEVLDIIWKLNHAGIWLASVGFTLFYAPLAAKTWRVHRIFTDAAVKGRVIKDDRLLCFVAALVVFDLVFLGLWLGIDSPQCHVVPTSQLPGFLSFTLAAGTTSSVETTSASVTSRTLEYVSACSSRFTPLWVILLTSYKAALLYYIIYVAWSTRYVTLPSMKDAGGLIISVFVTLTSFCVSTPFVTSLHRWPTAQYLVTSFAIFIPVFTVMFLHFIPKVVLIRRHNKDEVLTRSFSQYATPKSPEYTEDEIRDLAIQNASLRKEVAEKQRRYKTVLEQLRVAKAKLFEYSVMSSESTDMLAATATTDDGISRSITESSPMTSSESDSLKMADGDESKTQLKLSKTKDKKEKSNPAKEPASKVEQELSSQSASVTSPDDVSMDINSDATSEIAAAKPDPEIIEEHIIPRFVEEENSDKTTLLHHKETTTKNKTNEKEANQLSHPVKHRHVSFTDLPKRKEQVEVSSSPHRSLPAISGMVTTPKPVAIGKNSWDYYTRGTGYLKYKATVLNHGTNGTIAAITGYPVTDPNPNRIVARKNVAAGDVQVKKPARPIHSTPILAANGEGGVEMKTMTENPKDKKSEFRYFTTSASSRSPSTSTDMTSSVIGQSNDDTTSNNNIHPVDQNKLPVSLNQSSNNDTDVPSAKSAFSVVKSKNKRPRSGLNNVTVTSQSPLRHHGDAEMTHDYYSSGSDSDEYDDSTTSMDSITCELFPPLSPRHRHYLRRYDVMQAKYLAQREKYGRRRKKAHHSEKPVAYDEAKTFDVTIRADNAIPPTSQAKMKSMGRMYLDNESRRRLGGRGNRMDEGYLYDSITSSDSDSDYEWGNTSALQQCWEKAAMKGNFPLLRPGPITYSHTNKDGIFV